MAGVPTGDGQGSLFSTHPTERCTRSKKENNTVAEAEPPKAIYGDLTVAQVFEQVSQLAQHHGGKARNHDWDGAGEIEVFFVSTEEVIDFFRKIDSMCRRCQFRSQFIVETILDIHPNASNGIHYRIHSIIPAPIRRNT